MHGEINTGNTVGRFANPAPQLVEYHGMQIGEVSDEMGLSASWKQCRDNPGNGPHWRQFFARIMPLLRPILRNAVWRTGGGHSHEMDDLLQDVCLKLCELSRSDTPLPSETFALTAYFRAMAVNVSRDWLRKRGATKRGERVTSSLEDHMEELSSQIGASSTENIMLIRQVDLLLDCPARDRSVFWLYYRQGFTAIEIARIPELGLTVKGVESLLHRQTAKLRQKLSKGAE